MAKLPVDAAAVTISRRDALNFFFSVIPLSAYRKARLKKNGEPVRAPHRGGRASSSLLERESQPKGEQPHRRVIFDVGDSPGVATAIDTSIALGVVEAQDWVVKDVVGIHAELRAIALGEAEVLRERQIRSK